MKKIVLMLGLMVLWPLAAAAQERPSAVSRPLKATPTIWEKLSFKDAASSSAG